MSRRWLIICSGAVLAALTLQAMAPLSCAQDSRGDLKEPVYRVEQQNPQQQQAAGGARVAARKEQPQVREHPLMPAIRMAKAGLDQIDNNIRDYSATLIKRERNDSTGKVSEHQYIFLKVRHEPFSVYMYFLSPKNIKGRECIYVEGKNKGKLVAHEGGAAGRLLPTVHIDPNGRLAMRGQRYPITEVGIRNLTARLIEVAEADSKYGECDVQFFKGAKVNGRVCTGLQVVHPVPRDNFRFHIARIFIDDELRIPIRYSSYDWPQKQGEKPQLIEEYTYLNMKLNNGFTDKDFDEYNEDYNFH